MHISYFVHLDSYVSPKYLQPEKRLYIHFWNTPMTLVSMSKSADLQIHMTWL